MPAIPHTPMPPPRLPSGVMGAGQQQEVGGARESGCREKASSLCRESLIVESREEEEEEEEEEAL